MNRMNRETDEWMDEGWMKKCMNEWMNDRINFLAFSPNWWKKSELLSFNITLKEWTNKWMNEWMNIWMNEQIDDFLKMNEQPNERMNEWFS